ncbi:MAG TPA: bifunctional diaminohydroxyphosphoribosylaminopyrimidine deaminase/5-amino-6-(5-phosphoribosylamino)uracil reductase RibD [Steroidobacteraceae bacterium]|nr:bifunctional diaminohydroxyphosphoribosylaminopyrimidine deaminase/5-amino-6-(5-phosphoribosylamino)uracil reductase RibD [Steroidobacteraceae bacterium]
MSTPPQPPGSGTFSDFDRFAMQRALTLAARGLETTDPNPRVGCVIAQRGRVIGEGWHERAGEAHAEIAALRAAGNQAAGATVYVTLEPCSHHGRTPPCVEALIAARVARVLIGARDPNPQVDGKGAAALRAAGIAVESGLMEEEAIDLNAGFFRRMLTGRPLVRVKLAMSLDGRTALASGESRWITGEAARQDVQHWRARSSAVLTGIGTVLADDPRLDVRLPDEPGAVRRQPLRIVLDSQLRTPPGARLFETPGEVLILTTLTGPEDSRALELTSRGARLESLPLDGERVALAPVLDRLAELELNEVLVEAGATLAGEMLRQALVDELLLYVGLRLLGPSARALVTMPPLARLADAPSFSLFDMQPMGDDLRLRLRPGGTARAQR